jgi:hypothetical protein
MTIASEIGEKIKSQEMQFPAELPDIDSYRETLVEMIEGNPE